MVKWCSPIAYLCCVLICQTIITAFSYQVDYTIVGSVQYVLVGGQALPDNQAKPDLRNASLLGY